MCAGVLRRLRCESRPLSPLTVLGVPSVLTPPHRRPPRQRGARVREPAAAAAATTSVSVASRRSRARDEHDEAVLDVRPPQVQQREPRPAHGDVQHGVLHTVPREVAGVLLQRDGRAGPADGLHPGEGGGPGRGVARPCHRRHRASGVSPAGCRCAAHGHARARLGECPGVLRRPLQP